MSNIINEIKKIGIVPVIKLEDVCQAANLAGALKKGGVNCAEVTFRAQGADRVISDMVKAYPDMLVGAGTVLTIEQLEKAKEAGARFCVAPGLNPKVVKRSQEIGMPFIPGVSSGSEIEQALDLGLDTVKFFPAEQAGGVGYIKSVGAPYSMMRFMPTGGITADNLNSYLALDNVVACGGSWMVNNNLIKACDWKGVTLLCEDAVRKMLGFEFAHIGINAQNASTAMALAQNLNALFGFDIKDGNSSIFCTSGIEIKKSPAQGRLGHFAVRTNSIERAKYNLENKGYAFDEQSAVFDAKGKLKAIYLDGDYEGFAVHLVQK